MSDRSLRVERLLPCSLLSEGRDDAARFEAVWSQMDMRPGTWRARRFLDDDGGLFLKSMAIPMVCNTQMWRRRWDIHREAKNFARLGRDALRVPEVVAWGAESLGGIPTRSFLIEKRIHGAVAFSTYAESCADTTPDSPERPRVERGFRAVGRLVGKMHAVGLFHGDLATRNLMIGNAPEEPVVTLIDIPRAHWPRTPIGRAQLRRQDLYRITKSTLRRGVDAGLALELLKEAAGPEAEEVLERTLRITAIRKRLTRKARLYRWRWTGI